MMSYLRAIALLHQAKQPTKRKPLRDDIQAKFVKRGGKPGGYSVGSSELVPGERTYKYLKWSMPGEDDRITWTEWQEVVPLDDSVPPDATHLSATHAGLVEINKGYIFSANGLIRDYRGFEYGLDQPLYCWSTDCRVVVKQGQLLHHKIKTRHSKLFSMVRLWDYAFSHAMAHSIPKIVYWQKWLEEHPDVQVLYMSELQKWCMQQFSSLPDSRFVRFVDSVYADKIYWPLFVNTDKPSTVAHPDNIHRPLKLHRNKPFRVLYAIRGTDVRFRRVKNEVEVVSELLEWSRRKGLKFSVFKATSPKGDRDEVNQAVLLIGPHGGALANCGFLPRGGTCVELGGTMEQFRARPCFKHICRGLALDYRRVTGKDFGYYKPDFVVDIKSLRSTLDKIKVVV
ncbi:hypothetical protein [Sicyoidochytrium minutum DNA virus]|nr:hypothetical protein [Sicyoidochytrium minutum DNA virus]